MGVIQQGGPENNIETIIAHPLVEDELYHLVSRIGYAPQDSFFAWLRAKLYPRIPIRYKAEIVLYIRQAYIDK